MKKIFLLVLMMGIFFMGCSGKDPNNGANINQASAELNSNTAAQTIPPPSLSYFQERRTVEKWAKFWDKPSIPSYVYLFVFDKCIGYYVSDGKPASTRSYMVPETVPTYMKIVNGSGYTYDLIQSPDLDGTYGDNNPGIRFFTTNGNPVEFGGAGASYVYSAFPLPLDVPMLEKK